MSAAVMALPAQTRINGKPWFENGYMLVPYAPPKPHEQRLTLIQPVRNATCEEVFCVWFTLGHEGMDEGKPFKHPKSARCGDFSACLPCAHPDDVRGRKVACGWCDPCKTGTANCPCAGRVPHRLPNTPEYEHRVLDPRSRAHYRPQEVRHRRNIRVGSQTVSSDVSGDQWKDHIQEGLDARNHIKKRGL